METSFAQDAERKLGMDQQAIRKVQQNQKIMLGMHRLERAETQGPGLVSEVRNHDKKIFLWIQRHDVVIDTGCGYF